MDPLWLLRQPWFAISPGPWSIAFYAIFSLIGARILLRKWPGLYRIPRSRAELYHSSRTTLSKIRKVLSSPRLQAFLDALFLLFLVVLTQDTIWLLCNTVKWIFPLYSGVANFSNYTVPELILAPARQHRAGTSVEPEVKFALQIARQRPVTLVRD